jgi:N-acetylmuramic acid 6-phosphate etherase
LKNTETRITEQPSHYDHLEQMTVEEITADINHENLSVPLAVEKALPQLNQLIAAIEERLQHGGRLFYVGCGTGGRLATLDTIEVQNTYGTDGSQIQAIFPGGTGCLTQTRESREDDTEDSWQQLLSKDVSAKDIVVGISASGTTPFVLSALRHCLAAGITTGCIVNNPQSPIAQAADYPVEIITGPEFVTGSTRMKAGTAQKLCLDMISTTVQIRLGRVEGNKMVNAKLMNRKLIDRAVRIFMERNPQFSDYDAAKQRILQAGSIKKAEEMSSKNEI